MSLSVIVEKLDVERGVESKVVLTGERQVGVVGSRRFTNYGQIKAFLDAFLAEEDELVSGGAMGVDSMAQRYAKERGRNIHIYYPQYGRFGKGATFERNRRIVERSDIVLAFYARGCFGQGGTANTAGWARKLEKPLTEIEEQEEQGCD